MEWQRLRHAQAPTELNPELVAAALEEFRELGHDVHDADREADPYGLPQWTCRQCGSAITLIGTGEKWIPPARDNPRRTDIEAHRDMPKMR